MRRAAALAGGLLVTCVALPASAAPPAADARPTTVAVFLDALDEEPVRQSVESALARQVTVADGAKFAVAVHAAGLGKMGALPANTGERGALASAAATQHLDAVVVIRVVKTAHARQVSLEVIDAAAGASPVRQVRLPAAPSRTDDTQWGPMLADVGSIHLAPAPTWPPPPPPPPGDAAVPPPGPAPAPPATSPSNGLAPAVGPARDAVPSPAVRHTGIDILTVEADFDFGNRQFSYHDGITSNLRSYSLEGSAGVNAALEIDPFARSGSAVEGLGVVGDFRAALGADSKTVSEGSISTSWTRFDAGLRYALLLGGGAHPAVVAASAQYGQESFSFSPAESDFPSARYSFIRAGLDGRLPIVAGSGVLLGAAFLPVLSFAGAGKELSSPSVNGLELSAGYALHLARHWELVARFVYTRFFYAFDPNPGDPYVAGGALDQMFHGELGGRFLL